MGTQHPVPKKGADPQLSDHAYCGQTRLDGSRCHLEVGLGPGHIVLDGDGTKQPSQKRVQSPQFSAHFCCGQTGAAWMHQDATWYGCRPQPRGLCFRWRPSPPPQKGGGAPEFSAHVYCFFNSFRTRVKRLYACAHIQYLCFCNYEIRLNILRNPVTSLTLFILC